MKSVLKLTWRGIKSFFGRYVALFLIVMLSVGFFSGLKVTKAAMANTCEDYLTEQGFYDYRLYSTLGFTQENVDEFLKLDAVETAEGGKSTDLMLEHDGDTQAFKIIAMPEKLNLPSLTEGRMPEKANECLADKKAFSSDEIGTTIKIADSDEDDEDDEDEDDEDEDDEDEDDDGELEYTEFTIVGLCDSPLYLSDDRGTTTVGSGALEGFIYVPQEAFSSEIYTELSVTLKECAEIYSDEYDELIEEHEDEITELLEQTGEDRYDELLEENGLTPEYAEQAGIYEAETYVLTRDENAGYLSFESDTSIVSGIANIFPVFFILIAMLVCITTMTRMVDEERTQIGTLKALGFSGGAITAKYLLYAGSATALGWACGFFLGTWSLPQIFWYAYSSLYSFADMPYLFSQSLAWFTLAAAMAGILGSTLLSCGKELRGCPAELIRPKTAKTGKRILLERIRPLWRRFSFLKKITLRNMFRYKGRLIMMLVGIGCCAGLLVTGFGVRDSMIDIGKIQYGEIQKYDIEASFSEEDEKAVSSELDELSEVEGYMSCAVLRVELQAEDAGMSSINLYSAEDTEALPEFWELEADGETLSYPKLGEALISTRIAEKLELAEGDYFEIQDADGNTARVAVTGVFDNYVDNFVFISADTYEKNFGEWEANTFLIQTSEDSEELAGELTDIDGVSSIKRLSASRATVDSALSCLDYIIWLIVLFSGALAFIVIFNLTNINLAERSREIATVEVLGFYPKETNSYVLRENLILSMLAGIIGLPLGTLFHRVVMRMIAVDTMSFDVHISPESYALALVCTAAFAVIVNLFMRRQIGKIKMAESLKAVE